MSSENFLIIYILVIICIIAYKWLKKFEICEKYFSRPSGYFWNSGLEIIFSIKFKWKNFFHYAS